MDLYDDATVETMDEWDDLNWMTQEDICLIDDRNRRDEQDIDLAPRNRGNKKVNAYARLLANYPWVIPPIILVLVSVCGAVSYIYHPPPDFSDPTAGFEARQTKISGARKTLDLLLEAGYSVNNSAYSFTPNLTQYMKDELLVKQFMNMNRYRGKRRVGEETNDIDTYQKQYEVTTFSQLHGNETGGEDSPSGNILSSSGSSDEGMTTTTTTSTTTVKTTVKSEFDYRTTTLRHATSEEKKSTFIYDASTKMTTPPKNRNYAPKTAATTPPPKWIDWSKSNTLSEDMKRPQKCALLQIRQSEMKFVIEANDKNSDLFTAKNLRAICGLEKKYISPVFQKLYPRESFCQAFSIPLYVAALNNRDTCEQITDTDVEKTKSLLDKCAPFYFNRSLHQCVTNCQVYRKTPVPVECTQFNAVYRILFYLADVDFYQNTTKLKYGKLSSTLLMILGKVNAEEYKEYFDSHISYDGIKVSAIRVSDDLKYTLFDDYLFTDLSYFYLAGGLVLFILLIYLRSVVLLIATVLNVGCSFILAYFVYFFVLQLKFFPFMNLLAGLILIAVGADDVFIFHDAWEQIKHSGEDLSMERMVSKTFNHAALSIFVTSLTTSAAFFANYASKIIAIRCFGIFAGLAILANFLLMVTWTPAKIVMAEKCWTALKRRVSCNCWTAVKHRVLTINLLSKKLKSIMPIIFGKGFPCIIAKLWHVFIFLFLALGVGSLIVVFYTPRLQLPNTKSFQLFPETHPLEAWDLRFADKFQFEIAKNQGSHDDINIFAVWGVEPVDNGDPFDPDSVGHLVPVKSFDFFNAESQKWMDTFCHKLLNQSFISKSKTQVCPSEAYAYTISTVCENLENLENSTVMKPCCAMYNSPYNQSLFQYCLPLVASQVYTFYTKSSVVGKPIFTAENMVSGYLMEVTTNHLFSTSYEAMDELNTEIDEWTEEIMSTAPPGVKEGWFTCYYWFEFYDLQKAISIGTYQSIALSLGVAMVVMMLTSLNLLITLYAIFTITLAIGATVASIVLLGWRLNILESVTISLAVGLSIDFTIHYGVAYRLSKQIKSEERVREAFLKVGSAVFMAALTTFVAGAAMMPANVLAYIKLGIFLMLVMTFSWLYATFFFQSICHIIGPKGNFCQIPMPCKKKKNTSELEMRSDPDRNSNHSGDSDDSFLITF